MLDVSNIVPGPQGGGHSKSNKKTETLRYGIHPMTLRSRSIGISTEEFPNSSRGNEVSSRNRQIKVRKNEMKVRKKEIKVRKNFLIPPWIIDDLHRGIARFPPSVDFSPRKCR